MANQKAKNIWLRRADAITHKATQLLIVTFIYLLSELLIWGISRVLAGVGCEFFSSIIGMVLVFVITSILDSQVPVVDGFYRAYVKPLVSRAPSCQNASKLTIAHQVDWINGQMGVGFVIPLIMLDPEDILSGAEIGQIIANFSESP